MRFRVMNGKMADRNILKATSDEERNNKAQNLVQCSLTQTISKMIQVTNALL
jgi:hypothetical protein